MLICAVSRVITTVTESPRELRDSLPQWRYHLNVVCDAMIQQVQEGRLPSQLIWEIATKLQHFKSLVATDLLQADFKLKFSFKSTQMQCENLPMTEVRQFELASSEPKL